MWAFLDSRKAGSLPKTICNFPDCRGQKYVYENCHYFGNFSLELRDNGIYFIKYIFPAVFLPLELRLTSLSTRVVYEKRGGRLRRSYRRYAFTPATPFGPATVKISPLICGKFLLLRRCQDDKEFRVELLLPLEMFSQYWRSQNTAKFSPEANKPLSR